MGLFKWRKKRTQPVQPNLETKPKAVEKRLEEEKPKVEEKPVEEVETEKPVKKEEPTHKRKQQYHVSHHKDGWKVKLSNGEKAIKVFKTQAEAIEYAKHLAETHDTTYQIHKKDGSIRKKKY